MYIGDKLGDHLFVTYGDKLFRKIGVLLLAVIAMVAIFSAIKAI